MKRPVSFSPRSSARLGLAGCAVGPNYQRPAAEPPRQTHRGQAGAGRGGVARRPGLVGGLPGRRPEGADRRGAQERLRRAARRLAGRGGAGQRRDRPRRRSSRPSRGRRRRGTAGEFSPAGARGPCCRSTSTPPGSSTSGGASGARTRRPWRSYLASEEARRGVYLSLASEVATATSSSASSTFNWRSPAGPPAPSRRPSTCSTSAFRGAPPRPWRPPAPRLCSPRPRPTSPTSSGRSRRRRTSSSFLLGRNPGPIPRGAALNDQFLPPAVPPGLPSDLLEAAARSARGRAEPDRGQRRGRRSPTPTSSPASA